MSHGINKRHVAAWQQLQMMRCPDMWAINQFGFTWIDHDQLRTFPKTLLESGPEHGMCFGWIGADQHHDIGLGDRIKCLGAGRLAKGSPQSIAGG